MHAGTAPTDECRIAGRQFCEYLLPGSTSSIKEESLTGPQIFVAVVLAAVIVLIYSRMFTAPVSLGIDGTPFFLSEASLSFMDSDSQPDCIFRRLPGVDNPDIRLYEIW